MNIFEEIPGSGNIWTFCWFCLNIVLTLMNKAFFELWGFPFPIILSTIHVTITAICSLAFAIYFKMPTKTLKKKDYINLLFMSSIFTLNIMIGNMAMKYATVSLVQVVRSIIPGNNTV